VSIKDLFSKSGQSKGLPVVNHPDPRLQDVSAEVDLSDPAEIEQLEQLIDDLIATMHNEKGAGLSAIQVGIPKRVFVYLNDDKDSPGSVLINPTFTYMSDEKVLDEEGCLSFPALYAPVERSQHIIIEGYDENRNRVQVEARDFMARVMQHEVDHLDGITFINRLSDEDKKAALREYFDLRAL